jgi:hypothetical protein
MEQTIPADPMVLARDVLVRARLDLDREIRNYPRPVSGCDAQFNHLLAERRRAANALAALDEDIYIPTSRAP